MGKFQSSNDRIHWSDFPKDDISKILGYTNAKVLELSFLSQEYHVLDKSLKENLNIRAKKLFFIANFIEQWVNHELSEKDKVKHLKWLKDIAIKKGNYLIEIEKISQLDLAKELDIYHLSGTSKEPNYELLYLNKIRMYSLKKREYWGDFWIVSLDPCHRQLSNYLIAWERLNENNSYKNILDFFLWLENMEVSIHTPQEKYFNREERVGQRVSIVNKKLYTENGKVANFNQEKAKYLYVLDLDLNIYVCEETEEIFHSSFCNGKPVLAAGKIKVQEGEIKYISLESGHYIPSLQSGFNFIHHLVNNGYYSSSEVNLEFFYDRNKYSTNLNICSIKSYSSFENLLTSSIKYSLSLKDRKIPENPFDNPKKYRDLMLKRDLLNFKKKEFNGKSLACLFLTRFCGVGCPFCFYKSAPSWRKSNIEDQFSDEGVKKFIDFSKKANLGYLLISGGGEPLNQRKHIIQIVEQVYSDRIVLVTSGNWAKNYGTALKYVNDIYAAMQKRKSPVTVVVRVSVSSGHCAKLGYAPVRNLIEVFRKNYIQSEHLKLQIKTFVDDDSLDNALKEVEGFTISDEAVINESDNQILVKKIPKRFTLKFEEGLKVNVGFSKIFFSSLQADLTDEEFVEKSIKVFDEDLIFSEDNNPGVVFNEGKEPGIDWSINYNGDICTWQNQVRDNYLSLYEDSYENIVNANMQDPITYSLLDKGRFYRETILKEVNPRAITRMKAIALRDTSGAIIFEEEHSRLYFGIRVLQDYIADGKIKPSVIKNWPLEIRRLVYLTKKELIKLYKSCDYSIIKQQKNRKFDKQEWLDLFYLIRLGHYDLSSYHIQKGIDYYNNRIEEPLLSIEDVKVDSGDIERRLTERIMHIKHLKRFDFKEIKIREVEAC